MRFWDTSAIIPLLVNEPLSPLALKLFKEDPDLLVWTLTPVECCSALYRKEREGNVSAKEMSDFLRRLEAFEQGWSEVQDVERVRQNAQRLLAVHSLRAADALQLAAANVAFEGAQKGASFVTFDEVLFKAALKEGFRLIGNEMLGV